jgi:large subunit ribosomal protein L30
VKKHYVFVGNMANYVITQVRSSIGLQSKVKENLKSLGLKKIGSSSVIKKQPSSEGLIIKVSHLIKYEVVE